MSERITASEARALLVATRYPGDWYRIEKPDGDSDYGPNGEDYPTRHVACRGDPVADCDTPEVAAAVAALPCIVAALEHMEERHATLTAERDEARRVLLAIAEDVYGHPYRYTLAMLRRVLGIPSDGVESAAPDVRLALRRLCGVADG